MKQLQFLWLVPVLILCAASPTPNPEEATTAMLRAENLGGLRLELTEKEVLKLLGAPAKKGPLVHQDADGEYVEIWRYPAQGLELSMSAGVNRSGARKLASFVASAPCTLATKAGITIGSPEAAVRKAYAKHVDPDEPAKGSSFVAGSVYGGIIFNFEKGKVSRIFFGAAAE